MKRFVAEKADLEVRDLFLGVLVSLGALVPLASLADSHVGNSKSPREERKIPT